jgi:hypothetical protein
MGAPFSEREGRTEENVRLFFGTSSSNSVFSVAGRASSCFSIPAYRQDFHIRQETSMKYSVVTQSLALKHAETMFGRFT